MKPTVIIGDCHLFLGDCKEVIPHLPKVGLVLTDPPYGIDITKSNRIAVSRGMGGGDWDSFAPDFETIASVVAIGEKAVLWGGNYFGLPATKTILVWDKNNEGRDFADLEMAWSNCGHVARIFRMRPMNMDGGKEHPTQKPIALMEWCINLAPKNTSTVADPFMGSGTTGVACARMGKSFYGIEREPKYFEIACRRIEAAYAQPRLFSEPQQEKKPEQIGFEL